MKLPLPQPFYSMMTLDQLKRRLEMLYEWDRRYGASESDFEEMDDLEYEIACRCGQ